MPMSIYRLDGADYRLPSPDDLLGMMRENYWRRKGRLGFNFAPTITPPSPEAVLRLCQFLMLRSDERWRLKAEKDIGSDGMTWINVDCQGLLSKREYATLVRQFAALRPPKTAAAHPRGGSKYRWEDWPLGMARRLPEGLSAVAAIGNFRSWANTRGIAERLSTKTRDGVVWATRVPLSPRQMREAGYAAINITP